MSFTFEDNKPANEAVNPMSSLYVDSGGRKTMLII
jgi:hypothetical protein